MKIGRRKKVIRMPVAAAEKLTTNKNRETRLAVARGLSAKVTKATIVAGITHQELEDRAYKAFLNVRKSHHPDRY